MAILKELQSKVTGILPDQLGIKEGNTTGISASKSAYDALKTGGISLPETATNKFLSERTFPTAVSLPSTTGKQNVFQSEEDSKRSRLAQLQAEENKTINYFPDMPQSANDTVFDIDPSSVQTSIESAKRRKEISDLKWDLETRKPVLYLGSIGKTLDAAPGVLTETAKQAFSNWSESNKTPGYREAVENLNRAREQLDKATMKATETVRSEMEGVTGSALDFYASKDPDYQQAKKAVEEAQAIVDSLKVTTPVDINSSAMKEYTQAKQIGEKFLDGLEGWQRKAGEIGLSIGQNAALLPTAAIAPAAPLVLMSGTAAADKSYNLNMQGVDPAESLARGALSGAIEYATEKIPVESVLSIVKGTSGRTFLKNLLRQSGVEATEEGISYAANYLADKAFRDPNATFTLQELADNMLSGAVSGSFFASTGSAARAAIDRANTMATIWANKADPAFELGETRKVKQQTEAASRKPGEYRAVTPENVQFPSVPIINLSMQDVADMNGGVLPQTGNALRKDAISRARKRLGLDENSAAYIPASNVTRNGEEYILKITRASLNKMLSPADKNRVPLESILVLDNIERIANNGVWFDSQGDRKKRQQINGIDHLKTTVYIDGSPYEVDMRVRLVQENKRSPQENVLYYFTPEEIVTIEKVGTNPPTGERQALTGASEDVPTSPLSIAQNAAGGNTQSAMAATMPTAGEVETTLPTTEAIPKELPSAEGEDTISVGAAPEGFDPWSNFQNQRSEFFPEGANAARPVDVPTTDLEGRNIRKTASTAMGAKAIPDEVVQDIQNMVLSGKLSYDVNTDKGSVRRAVQRIKSDGYQRALGDFSNAVQKGVVSKDLATLGQQLLVNAANAGDGKATAELLSLYAQMETTAGQAVQAASILRKLEPTYQLYAAQKAVDNLQNTLSKKLKGQEIKIDPDLVTKFEQQTDQAGRDAVMEEIYQNIADQVPSTWKDKWNAWRYLSMLGNPRTHIRNIVGNVGFQPVRFTKDRVAALIESGVSAASGGKLQRTKSFAYSPELYSAAWSDYNNVAEVLSGSKYDDIQSIINDRRTIFKTKPLETARRANTNALSAEDAVFKRVTYADALAGYLNANGVTADQLRSGQVNESLLSSARDYAGQEALKATYNDKNDFSNTISSIGSYSGENKFGKALSAGVSAVLPFKRTPANILARGFEYSPLGLTKGLTYDLAKVKSGEMTGAQAIDNIASGLTGSGLMALGAYLAAQGMVTGGDDPDEKQQTLNELTGGQSYALNLPGGGSVTLDWLAPEALPFFMGVQLMNSMGENGLTADSITESLSSVSEPMLEMSMLQSLNDLIDNVSYAASNEKLTGLARSALISYLTQAIPTLGGQAERSSEDVRMSTYTDKNLPLPTNIQYAIGKATAKLPGIDYQQIPYIDEWGREESSGALPIRTANNFLNPAYTSQRNVTALDQEVQRLYDQTGDGGVVPSRANRYLTVNGERKDLTKDEYLSYAKDKGQSSYEIASSMIGRQAYNSLTDEEKAKAISDAYSYADAVAKSKISNYEPSSWIQKVESAGIDPGTAILYRAKKSSLEDQGVQDVNAEIRALIMEDSTMSAEQKSALDKAILTDGMYIPRETNVDYSDNETFSITQLSGAGQKRWPAAKDWGMSAEDYARYYPICSASGKKKAEILQDLVNAGMTESQANEFWKIVKN